MALSWRMVSSLLLPVALCTHCIEDDSDPGNSSGSGGSGGRTEPGGGVGGTEIAGQGGASPAGGRNTGGARPGGAGNGGSGGVEEPPPACVPSGEAGSGMTCCWECPWGEPCRHLECGNGTQEEGCLFPFACYQSSPAGGISGPYHYEECDDGNQKDGDGCSSTCFIEYDLFCGNGQIDDHEDCDDGNREPDDGCDQRCQGRYWYHCDVPGEPCVEDVCGDGRSGFGQCDDGNIDSGDGCSEGCVIELGWACPPEGACEEAYCGNRSVDQYSVDDEDGFGGAFNGDGGLIRREDCDDGNQVSGDGCSAECRTEEGWDCSRYDGTCLHAECGDGYVFRPEQCDDGNAEPDDGCDEHCAREPGWICRLLLAGDGGTGGAGGATSDPQPPLGRSACSQSACGDGVVYEDDGEECDDGNLRSGDGCSDDCRFEGEPCTGVTE